MYLGIDAIADRDLGFAMARKATATNSLGKSEEFSGLGVHWIKVMLEFYAFFS